MIPNREAQVDALLEQALDVPEAERDAWIAVRCADDSALRHELVELLTLSAQPLDAALARVQGFAIDALGGADAAADAVDESGAESDADAVRVGDRIGDYTVLAPLGRGGMGVVYLARRDGRDFEQKVAIKVLPHTARSAGAVRRFEQERRILARLQHPHIAHLLDGGVDRRGLPYLVLEHVEGEPIDRWCDARAAPLEQRLRLVIEIATALQSAHRSLVVHRDLKPANLLVTADGDVKLLDFGIAKLLDASGEDAALTRADTRPLTPTYASPEQVSGDPITVASDVYQLGLLLYELVSGRRPQEGRRGSLAELVELVCKRDPEPLHRAVLAYAEDATPAARAARRGTTAARLARRCRPDLDAIVACALAKQPERRYASVAELAADLERFLESRPVRAHRATVRHRAGRWVRRNAAFAAAATVALVLTAGYALAATAQARSVERQRRRAEAEATKAARVEQFVLDMFASVDPSRWGGGELSARELVERGVRRAERELQSQPEVRARVLSALGEISADLGDADRGRALVADALEQQRRTLGERHPEVAESLRRLGVMERRRGDPRRARILLERAVALRREQRPLDEAALARSLADLGILANVRGDTDRAEVLYRESLEIHRRRGDRSGIAVGLSNLGTLSSVQGHFEEAERYHREALALKRTLYGERSAPVAVSLGSVGTALRRQKRFTEAIPLLEEALVIEREHFPPGDLQVVSSLMALGIAQQQAADLAGAEASYAEVMTALAAAGLPPNHLLPADARLGLGQLRVRQGRFAEGEALLRQSLAVVTASLGPRHHRVGWTQLWLGRAVAGGGQIAEAVGIWKAALEVLRPGADDEFIASVQGELARAGATAGSPPTASVPSRARG